MRVVLASVLGEIYIASHTPAVWGLALFSRNGAARMVTLDYDFTVEGANHDLTRLIDRYLQRGNRTLTRAFKFRDTDEERYQEMLNDAARDFWAAQRVGALADGGEGDIQSD